MTLEDAANKVLIPGHFGPHAEAYHLEIYRRLRTATRWSLGRGIQAGAVLNELNAIAKEREVQVRG